MDEDTHDRGITDIVATSRMRVFFKHTCCRSWHMRSFAINQEQQKTEECEA